MSLRDETRAPATAADLEGGRRLLLGAYHWLLRAFLVAGVVQLFLAGSGVFRADGPGRLAAAGTLDPHRLLGSGLAVMSLALLVLAVLARPGTRLVRGTAVFTLTVFGLVPVAAALGEDAPWAAGLHPVLGVAALALGGWLETTAGTVLARRPTPG